MANNKYENQLKHEIYNDIQYIMGRNDKNLQGFSEYEKELTRAFKEEKAKTFALLKEKRDQHKILRFQKIINGKNLMFDTQEIANAATKKIQNYNGKFKYGQNSTQALEAIYKNLQQGFENYGITVSALQDFIKVSKGILPSGSKIYVDKTQMTKIEQLIKQQESYEGGKLSNLLGDLGETTTSANASAITDALIEDLAKQLQIDKNGIKVKAKIKNVGNQSQQKATVQTDNVLNINFSFDENIIAQFSDLKNGLNLKINLSDKANKKLSSLASTRRRATNSLTFRSSSVKTLLKESNSSILSKGTYNLISYHKQGIHLTGFMSAAPGFALRRYFGYKLLQKMFLSEGELNYVDFTVYGTSIYAETEVFDKLNPDAIMADIEYWSLKDLVGKYRGDTIQEGLKKGTAEARKRIDDMKVTIRASLGLKKLFDKS